MVFQSPGTSFNPVFTVGYQIGLVAERHLGIGREGGAAPGRRDPACGRPPEPGERDAVLPARALGRDAAARDDRDGDHLQAEPADRRRADDRARRDDRAADPAPAAPAAAGAGLRRLLHQPRPRPGERLLRPHRRAVRRPRRRDGATAQLLGRPRHPYTRALLEALPGRTEPGRAVADRSRRRPGRPRRGPGVRVRPALPARRSSSASRSGRRSPPSARARPLRATGGMPCERQPPRADGRGEGVSGSRVGPEARLDPRRRRRRPRDPAGARVRPRRRIGVGEDDRGPLRARADSTHRTARSSSTGRTSRPSTRAPGAACGARSRSSSSSRWPRSTRG